MLRNRIVDEWLAAGSPASGQRAGEGEITGKMPVGGGTIELPRYSIFMPMEGFGGELDSFVLYAGKSCSLVSDVRPAADIVAALATDADADAIRTAAAEGPRPGHADHHREEPMTLVFPQAAHVPTAGVGWRTSTASPLSLRYLFPGRPLLVGGRAVRDVAK